MIFKFLWCLIFFSGSLMAQDSVSFYVEDPIDDTEADADVSDVVEGNAVKNPDYPFDDDFYEPFSKFRSSMFNSFHNLWNDVNWRGAMHQGVEVMSDAMDKMLETHRQSQISPEVVIEEKDDEVLVTADLTDTGIDPNGLEVTVDEQFVTLKGNQKIKIEETTADGAHRIKTKSSVFLKSYSLPNGINADDADIEVDGEIVKVSVPKSKDR